MSDEKKKFEKLKLVKILGGLAVAGVIAYYGWGVLYSNTEGIVRSATEELLTKSISQECEEFGTMRFIEVESFKIDSVARNKWDGEANAKVRFNGSKKDACIRYTFDVEKKGNMVYVQNLRADEKSFDKLISEAEKRISEESESQENKTHGESESQSNEENAVSGSPKITDMSAYIVEIQNKTENMTSLQKEELCENEAGRYAEDVFIVSDVRKNDLESVTCGQSVVEIRGTWNGQGDKVWRSVFIVNIKESAEAYKTAMGLSQGMRVRVFGSVYFDQLLRQGLSTTASTLFLVVPSVVAHKLEIVEDVEDGL